MSERQEALELWFISVSETLEHLQLIKEQLEEWRELPPGKDRTDEWSTVMMALRCAGLGPEWRHFHDLDDSWLFALLVSGDGPCAMCGHVEHPGVEQPCGLILCPECAGTFFHCEDCTGGSHVEAVMALASDEAFLAALLGSRGLT